jgi:AAA+ superfamily predicted ATPase
MVNDRAAPLIAASPLVATLEVDLTEIERELDWLASLLDSRLRAYFAADNAASAAAPSALAPVPAPDLSGSATPYSRFVADHAPTTIARTALVLALAPPLRPQMLDVFFTRNSTFDRRFTEFGGLRLDDDFIPTVETLAFFVDGGSVAARVAAARIVAADHDLVRADTWQAVAGDAWRGAIKTPLRLADDKLALFTTGIPQRPLLSADFPAQRISTDLAWDDLVLHRATLEQIGEIQTFIAHGETLMKDWGLAPRLRPGLRALFHGPPGTGKTLSAALIGQASGRDVYRVDLSLVVSKYIGETEKNLSRVFDRAERNGWILFFDEAEALFGKRSETRDAHDRYANQEVAYLLQRIETFDGITILASNLRENLDRAFARRFELMVYFPLPRAAERELLWRRALPQRARLADDVDLSAIARDHELSGGAIVNIVRQVCLAAIAEGSRPISASDLALAIKREMSKEGRHA